MEAFTDFLAANYFWFLIISLVLIFALIGYFVDQQEQKKGISMINKPKEEEVDLGQLAALAQNKSMNDVVANSLKNNPTPTPNANVIIDRNAPNQNSAGFDVLTK